MNITANEVKTKGVSVFDTMFEKFNEVLINVRGKNKYCVIPFEEYEEYRAYQLDKAHKEVMQDLKEGKYHTSVGQHIDSIKLAIKND
ncbi:prevent-host-death protein [Bathymodiolus septemdierum thioautotrophic gill symbiont]|uniref:Addiction module antitoxin n=1 Tax=endosymbiont of Bathymodiolus septemdierum str. Myojin knoll TaxID=1303921 RepID=A0A0P0URE9_9GAMM|nr:prevent-host-death protein [Bathymodiolus septemdierum thioautotrophic gill symbiont]BAS67684.1 addiction module antitoxin [endosymbiont of Bathymodiolus septemdierum str. Myojin knoll]